jgi:hypothetical protein
MALKDILIGIWILALWSVAHVVPAVLLAADTTGAKSVLLWSMIAGEVVLAAGLILGWRACRYLALAQVIAHALVFATVGWAFVFVAFAWGLHGNEVPILAGVGAYVLFTGWAFVYLFHPGVQDYFSRQLTARA